MTKANGSSYQTRDSTGSTTDTIKIVPSSAPGSYLGVYHAYQSGLFSVRVGTSTDLLHWTYQGTLEPNASQPTIAPLSDGSFLVAYETNEPGGAVHLEFRTYRSFVDLLLGRVDRQYDAPRTLSRYEGTPSIREATLRPGLDNSTIRVGFHYYRADLGVDRNAKGVLTNFSSWSSQVANEINNAFSPAPGGNIGDRDHLTFEGYPFTLIEAQARKGDYSSWRVYLYDETARTMTRLNIHTAGGSRAFGNPTATVLTDPNGHRALGVSLFLFFEGAQLAPGEAGPLVYYTEY